MTYEAKEVYIIKETYITVYELSSILGIPIPNVIEEIKCRKIKATITENGMTIPISQFYPSLFKDL